MEEVVIQTEYGADKLVAPSNSINKPKRKKVEAVANGSIKKESLAKKVISEFITCDLKTVGETAITNILIPYIKDMVLDILHDSVDMIFGGGTLRRARSINRNGATYISYGSFYPKDKEKIEPDRRAGYDFKEITFKTRSEVEDIIEHMYDILDTDGFVSVADFYSLAGLRSAYTDETYGWKNLRAVTPKRIRDVYIVDLPKPLPLR